MKDLLDLMGDTGRMPRSISDSPNNRVEKAELYDCTMVLHFDNPQQKAVLVSDDGDESKAVWLPTEPIKIHSTGKTAPAKTTKGKALTLPTVEIAMPEWLAKEKGLI